MFSSRLESARKYSVAAPVLRTLTFAATVAFVTACASAGTPPPTLDNSSNVESNSDPVDAIMRMRVRGLLVSRTSDGGIALQLSGPPASIDRDTQPLYLLDDAEFEPGPNGALTGINPADIASIRVLQRADAAIYGLRGANGVIAITTKRAANKKN